MAHAYEIPITLVGKRRIDAYVHGHLIRTDQPISKGGGDDAPSPFDLFLASIGTCAGITIQGFCAKRDIVFEDIKLVERVSLADDGVLIGVDIDIQLPATFPDRYVAALHNVIAQCPVAKSMLAHPHLTVTSHKGEVLRTVAPGDV